MFYTLHYNQKLLFTVTQTILALAIGPSFKLAVQIF